MTFSEILKKKIPLFDGGTGTLLVEKGLKAGERPEFWNLTRPEEIKALHKAYIEAGADIIKTNTFGAYRHKFEEELPALVAAAVKNAREAAEQEGKGTLIALDLGPTGNLLEPLGTLPFEEAVALFGETVRLGAPSADLILIETMSDLYELKAAVLAAKENSSLPVVATCSFDATGRLMTGADVETVTALLEGLGVDALGMNCGFGPEVMLPLIRRMTAVSSLPVVANPNAGLPEMREGKTVYSLTPEDFAKELSALLDAGVSLAGGCCGTTPAHIAALAKVSLGRSAPEVFDKGLTVATSPTRTVVFDGKTVLVGERLIPTGKPAIEAALREGDFDTLVDEALDQKEEGAAVLDLNVALPASLDPALSEKTLLPAAVMALQETVDLPLSLDSADPAALERACRLYNGKPVINSVNGRKESLDALLPIVKKYGGVLVALTLDERGIPDSAAGRLAVAEKISAEAKRCGIAEKNILFDPLALTVAVGPENEDLTLATLKALREAGRRTLLGISNISYGMPHREQLNAGFLTKAMAIGLDAAILNPASEEVMAAYEAAGAAAGPSCLE